MTEIAFTVCSTSAPHLVATKTIWVEPDGSLRARQYDGVFLWMMSPRVTDFDGLAHGLKAMAKARHRMIVMGGVRPGVDTSRPQQRTWADPAAATLQDVPRAWCPLDINNACVPDGLANPERFAEMALWVRDHALPPEFGGCRAVASPTSSTGLKGPREGRARLWFVLDRPVPLHELHRWGAGAQAEGFPIDPHVLSPGQPIYCARPDFSNMRDPVPPELHSVVLPGAPTVRVELDRYRSRLAAVETWETTARPDRVRNWQALLDKTLAGPCGFFRPLTSALSRASRTKLTDDEIVACVAPLVEARADPDRLRAYDNAWMRASLQSFRRRDREKAANVKRLQSAIGFRI